MSNIRQFQNETLGASIRVIDRDGEPWFVAKDVAVALSYSDTDQAIRQHCKSVQSCPVRTTGQVRQTKIIPESDLYRLILKSHKPEAEAFQDWVTGEILPSIRKHGAYMTPKTLQEMLADPQQVVSLLEALRGEQEERQLLEDKEAIFGNRTTFGKRSRVNGQPRTSPVRGYLRSNQGMEIIITETQLRLFDY